MELIQYRDSWLGEKFNEFVGFYPREFYCLDNFSSFGILYMGKQYPNSIIPVLVNYLLLILWLPTLLFGLDCFIKNLPDIDNGSALLGQWIAIVIGAVLHEIGHASATLCYGGRVFEAGSLLQNYMPGAYVMIDDKPVRKRLQKVQILAAGVEMNMLLSGIGWLLLRIYPQPKRAVLWLCLRQPLVGTAKPDIFRRPRWHGCYGQAFRYGLLLCSPR